jgi:hypothetical protein
MSEKRKERVKRRRADGAVMAKMKLQTRYETITAKVPLYDCGTMTLDEYQREQWARHKAESAARERLLSEAQARRAAEQDERQTRAAMTEAAQATKH